MKKKLLKRIAFWVMVFMSLPGFAVMALGFVLFFVHPLPSTLGQLRHDGLSLFFEMPNALVKLYLREAVERRNFKRAIDILGREKKYLDWAGGRLYHKLQLIENTAFVANSALFIKEHEVLEPWLTQLYADYPKSYRAKALLAENRLYTRPETVEKLARSLQHDLPADALSSRLGTGAAHLLADNAKRDDWHQQYQKQQLGGFRGFFTEDRTRTTSALRQFFLEVMDDKTPVVAINRGLQLGSKQWYDFEFSKKISLDYLRLHLPVTEGVRLQIHAIRFYGDDGIHLFKQGQWRSWTSRGFFEKSGSLLLTHHNGSTVFLLPAQGRFPVTSRVDISLSITRPAMDHSGSGIVSVKQ